MKTKTKLIGILSSVTVAVASVVALSTAGASAATGEQSLFAETSTPSTLTDPDTSQVELGVKVTALKAGNVNGIKFYKGPQNNGTHTGTVWNSSGSKLASVVFTGESASGWQTARLSTSVHVNANQTVTISYHAPRARYSSTGNYFTASQTHGDLKTPRNAGVYRYGGIAFPTQTYQASNYWVDLLFAPDGVSPSPSASTSGSPSVSPSASNSPSPTPSQTPSQPPSGDYPTAMSVGVPAGTNLTSHPGDISLGAGQVLDSVHVTGDVTVTGNGVVIKNSQIDGTVRNIDSRPSFTIQDSQVGRDDVVNADGNGAIGNSNYTARRVKLINFPDGFRVAGSNVDIQDSYVKVTGINGVHADGLQLYGASGAVNIIIRHNVIDDRTAGENAAIFLPGDRPDQNNSNAHVTDVSDNVVAGGGYTVFVPGSSPPLKIDRMADNHVVNNTWEYQPYGVYCPYVTTFTGNDVVTYDFSSGKIVSTVREVGC